MKSQLVEILKSEIIYREGIFIVARDEVYRAFPPKEIRCKLTGLLLEITDPFIDFKKCCEDAGMRCRELSDTPDGNFEVAIRRPKDANGKTVHA